MSDFEQFDPERQPEQPAPGFNDAFASMEEALSQPMSGDWIRVRNGDNEPRYAPLYEGEQGLTIRQACDRLGLYLGIVTFYFDNAAVTADTVIPNHGTFEIVGNVKGG